MDEFRDAHDVEINFIASNLKTLLVLPNDTIIQQGTFGENMFFIINGKVNVILMRSVVKRADILDELDNESMVGTPKFKRRKRKKKMNKKLLASSQLSN